MPTPYWKITVNEPVTPGTEGPPLIRADQGIGAWMKPLVDGRALPGLVKMVKAPKAKLRENFSKAKNKDAQVRKILGLESAEWAFECTLNEPEHLKDYEDMQPLLLPVEDANGRGEVRAFTYPSINMLGFHWAYVFCLEVENPSDGKPMKVTVHFRHFIPGAADKRKSNVDKVVKGQDKPVPTVDIAQTTPTVPRERDLARPSPSRTK